MNEHDEAALVGHLRDRLVREGKEWTADEMLADLRDVLRCYEEEERLYAGGHAAEYVARHRQAVADAARWRRILADPALPAVLAGAEDRVIFGEAAGPVTSVVNVRTAPPGSFVYVGRRAGKFPASRWGNPFRPGMTWEAAERVLCSVGAAVPDRFTDALGVQGCLRFYELWVLAQPDLVARLPELRGKKLGCWCSPAPCHAAVLARLADGEG